MATHLCHHVTSNNSSAFVPIIGLYIAGASMVCFILLIRDVVHGIRRGRLWLPCRKFSVNSFTLSLLSTAAKITMDITTPMPSAWDQVSKLTGTAFICACMAYLLPSLGTNSASDSITNTGALSIFVVTVIVNIGKQMSTGVIFSFIPEHVIIMSFMLALLCHFWISTWNINKRKETQKYLNKGIFTDGKGSPTMLERLKLCYLLDYNTDPQVLLCKHVVSYGADIVCLFCSIVVLQVLLRAHSSHDFRYCNEVSNYGWSVKIIVATQVLVILLASFTTSVRGVIMSDNFKLNCKCWCCEDPDGVNSNAPYLRSYGGSFKSGCIKILVSAGFLISILILALPGLLVSLIFRIAGCCVHVMCKNALKGLSKKKNALKEEDNKEYHQLMEDNHDLLSDNDINTEEWILKSCMDDIHRCINTVTKDAHRCMNTVAQKKSLSKLKELLSRRPPSGQSLGNEVSILHLVFLQRIAAASLPSSSLKDHLTQSLNDRVFDIVHSVDAKLNSSSSSGAKKCRLAKAMWKGEDFSRDVPKILEGWKAVAPSDLDRAVRIISGLKTKLPPEFIWNEVSFVMEFIKIEDRSRYTTIEELSGRMEQLFVDMLHMFLMRIPEVIYKEVTESPPEKYLNKVRDAVKLVYRVKALEGIVQWSFPGGCNIASLIPADHHENDKHRAVDKV